MHLKPIAFYLPRLATTLCAIAVCILVLAMPFGRPLAAWLATFTLGALVVGVVLARIVGSVAYHGLGALLLFGAATLASMQLSPWATQSTARATPSLLLLLVFPAAQAIARSPRALRGVRLCMAAAIIITAADVAWQPLFGSSLLLGVIQHPADPRFTGSLPNANEVGFVALLVPLASRVTPIRSIGRSVPMLGGLIMQAVALVPILLSASRATLGGYGVGACTRSWFGDRRFVRWAPAIAICLASIAWLADFGAFRHRLAETLAPQQESRLRTWSIAWNAFTERPWFGNGPAVFFEVNEASRKLPQVPGWETPAGGMPWAHNIPLEILCERGLVGALTLALVITQLVWNLRAALRSPTQRDWAAAVAASAASFGAMSLLDMSFLKDWCTVCFWLTCGFAAAAAADARSREAQPEAAG